MDVGHEMAVVLNDNRLGRIRIQRGLLANKKLIGLQDLTKDGLLPLMYHTDDRSPADVIVITGLHKRFKRVLPGKLIPVYTVTIHQEEGEIQSITYTRED